MFSDAWDVKQYMGYWADTGPCMGLQAISWCKEYWALYGILGILPRPGHFYNTNIHIAHMSTFMIKVCVWCIGYVLLFILALILSLQYNHIFLWDIVLLHCSKTNVTMQQNL